MRRNWDLAQFQAVLLLSLAARCLANGALDAARIVHHHAFALGDGALLGLGRLGRRWQKRYGVNVYVVFIGVHGEAGGET